MSNTSANSLDSDKSDRIKYLEKLPAFIHEILEYNLVKNRKQIKQCLMWLQKLIGIETMMSISYAICFCKMAKESLAFTVDSVNSLQKHLEYSTW